jgi:AcrR family transcriptional regulator
MERTRDGLLDGALACIQRDGLHRLTMSGICTRSGVAKATLYNHFRTKADVLAALVGREVDRVADAADAAAAASHGPSHGAALGDGLAAAADYIAAFTPGRTVALSEPQALVPLLTVGEGPGWAHARARAAGVLSTDPQDPVVDLVLVWLGSVLIAAPAPQSRRAAAELLAAAATAPRPRPADGEDIDPVAGASRAGHPRPGAAAGDLSLLERTDPGSPGAGLAPVTAGTTGTSR